MRIVDGGHRAIKYTRLGGVKKEIYNEGRRSYYNDLYALHDILVQLVFRATKFLLTKSFDYRNSFHDSMVRDSHHL